MYKLNYKQQKNISHWLIFFCCFILNITYGQHNLVPNYSFEDYIICPNLSVSSPPPPPWYIPTKTTYQDGFYCNACSPNCAGVPYNCYGLSSFQYAHTGQAYGSFTAYTGTTSASLDTRNYWQIKLADSLKVGKCYYVEFFVSLINTVKYGSNNISLLFTKNAKYVDTLIAPFYILPSSPQITNYSNPIITDTLNWVKVSGVFIAQGGEKYITIGNFKDNTQTSSKIINNSLQTVDGAEYYLDDVSVIPLDSMPLKADAGKDTSIANVGDSVFIGSLTNGLTAVKWYDANNVEITSKAGVPGFFASPTASTFYIIEQTVCGYYSRDTINVTVGTIPLKFISYNLISSLRGTKQSIENLWITANEINVSHFNILKSNDGVNFKIIGKNKAQNKIANEYSFIDETLYEGLNYYKIESVDFDGRKQYSQTRTKSQISNELSVYPNPSKNYINIACNEMKEIKIVNQFGQLVYQIKSINSPLLNICTKEYAKGFYTILVTAKNGDIKTEKIIIE